MLCAQASATHLSAGDMLQFKLFARRFQLHGRDIEQRLHANRMPKLFRRRRIRRNLIGKCSNPVSTRRRCRTVGHLAEIGLAIDCKGRIFQQSARRSDAAWISCPPRADVIVTPDRREFGAQAGRVHLPGLSPFSKPRPVQHPFGLLPPAHIKLRQVRADWRGRLPPRYVKGEPESGPGYIAVANSPSSS